MSTLRPPRRDDTIAIPVATIRRVLMPILVVIVIVALGWLGLALKDRFFGSEDRRVDHSSYQAVFLVSSQVYFGKLTIDGDDYLLRDIFYLNAPQQGTSAGQLVKRGNELHGPVEPMIIPARSVLFFENMRDDSEVLAAIRGFKAGVTPAPQTSVPTTASPQVSATRSPSPSPTR